MSKPKIGIFGLTGCAGDQLVILNCEDQLLDLVAAVDIRDFLTATSANDTESRLDVAFVEGAVLSKRDEETLKKIRERSDVLVALGTCAVWGGIPALDRGRDRLELLQTVYGNKAEQYDTMPTKALHEVVKVDLNISGCPIEKEQFLSSVADLLNGNPPLLPDYAVCAECKWKENNCLLIEKGEVCCGPLTIAGCKARCPELNVACAGCRGPATDANVKSAVALFQEKGISLTDVAAKFRTFAPVQITDKPE
jgi:coenzyme F420-reducing hydrogenase gamma subunit